MSAPEQNSTIQDHGVHGAVTAVEDHTDAGAGAGHDDVREDVVKDSGEEEGGEEYEEEEEEKPRVDLSKMSLYSVDELREMINRLREEAAALEEKSEIVKKNIDIVEQKRIKAERRKTLNGQSESEDEE